MARCCPRRARRTVSGTGPAMDLAVHNIPSIPSLAARARLHIFVASRKSLSSPGCNPHDFTWVFFKISTRIGGSFKKLMVAPKRDTISAPKQNVLLR